MITWLREHILKYIDIKYLSSRIAIFVFSGLISIAPIFFLGLDKAFENKNTAVLDTATKIKESALFEVLYDYIYSSTDFVYALVSLSTIVLADVLESKKEGSIKFILGLFHIVTVVFGILIYAYYKTHDVSVEYVKELNRMCFGFVVGLSLLSYVRLAIVEKRKEDVRDEH